MPAGRRQASGVYLVVAHAAPGTRAAAANEAFNRYVADRTRGLALSHDHFVDRPGGYAVFACRDAAEAGRLRAAPELAGWTLSTHPLTFARDAVRWLYQMDFTLTHYRGVRLEALLQEYFRSDEYARLRRVVPPPPER